MESPYLKITSAGPKQNQTVTATVIVDASSNKAPAAYRIRLSISPHLSVLALNATHFHGPIEKVVQTAIQKVHSTIQVTLEEVIIVAVIAVLAIASVRSPFAPGSMKGEIRLQQRRKGDDLGVKRD